MRKLKNVEDSCARRLKACVCRALPAVMRPRGYIAELPAVNRRTTEAQREIEKEATGRTVETDTAKAIARATATGYCSCVLLPSPR